MTDLEAFVRENFGTNDIRHCGLAPMIAGHLPHLAEAAQLARSGYAHCETCAVLALLADRDAKLAAVRELHLQSVADPMVCAHCGGLWPCLTIETLGVSHE